MGKGKRRQLQKQGEALRQKYPKIHRPLICPLCGEHLQRGSMLAHKERLHGEKQITPSPTGRHNGNSWVSVVQGGLPSLGKRAK